MKKQKLTIQIEVVSDNKNGLSELESLIRDVVVLFEEDDRFEVNYDSTTESPLDSV
jgi:hypothetical protein